MDMNFISFLQYEALCAILMTVLILAAIYSDLRDKELQERIIALEIEKRKNSKLQFTDSKNNTNKKNTKNENDNKIV